MKVRVEFLIPGVQGGNKAQFSAKCIFTEGQQRLRGGLKKDIEHHAFIV